MNTQDPGSSKKRPEVVVLREKGIITIPQTARNATGLDIGDQIIVTVDGGRIVLTPARVVPRDHPNVRAEDIPLQSDSDTHEET